jgi:hypothetical protein
MEERNWSMPIFMDRHDMRGSTAENIAEAHRKDLEIQDKYGVKYMTYWYDPERSTGFCLVEAPDAETAEHVHREAHGQIASDIIAVDLAAVEAFLGRINDPRHAAGTAAPEMGAGLRAVMFTDIVGSTENDGTPRRRSGPRAGARAQCSCQTRASVASRTRGKAHRRRDHGRIR